eukprot:255409_1
MSLLVLVFFCCIYGTCSKKKINGIDCISIRELFGTPENFDTSSLDIYFANGFGAYFINVNGKTWLQSGETAFRNNGDWAQLKLSTVTNHSGYDPYGQFNEIQLIYTANGGGEFGTQFRYYPESPEILLFTQTFPDGANKTTDPTNDIDAVITSFPSFQITTIDSSTTLGFVHFGGSFAASIHPQFGEWNKNVSTLSGGLIETGPLAIFDSNMKNTIVISALTDHMSVSDNITTINGIKQFRWGLLGNISIIPPKYTVSMIMTLTHNGGGVNVGMREWGERQLQYYGVKHKDNSHDRDFTLQWLGYSTDNGAYYYYYTEPGKNYQQTILDIHAYHKQIGLPTKWILYDSWWYFKGEGSGVKNWTARSDIFPDGLSYMYQQTGWKVQAHNRFWSLDNVYASNPPTNINIRNGANSANDAETFPFTWGNSGLPTTYDFWQYLFDINNDWGMVTYEQDWMSTSEHVPMVLNSTSFGREWLLQMGQSAYSHDLSIQYCMTYPRHVMTTVEIAAGTQTRASGDYHPSNDQWKVGISSIFVSSVGLAPIKDSWWSQPGYQPGPYSNTTNEPYNRLQGLVVSLTNGPVMSADQIGHADVALIMKCCNSDGMILRPDTSATEIDAYFLNAAGLAKNNPQNGEVWSTTSVIGNSEYFRYYYVFAATLTSDFVLYPSDITHYNNGIESDVITSWIGYETNTTTNYMMFNETNPITLKNCPNKWNFQYYSFIPILNGDSGWYLQGEVDKWISVSRQRFKQITNDDSSVNVKIFGAVGENVNVAFVKYPDMIQQIVNCKIGETQTVEIRMPAATCTPY